MKWKKCKNRKNFSCCMHIWWSNSNSTIIIAYFTQIDLVTKTEQVMLITYRLRFTLRSFLRVEVIDSIHSSSFLSISYGLLLSGNSSSEVSNSVNMWEFMPGSLGEVIRFRRLDESKFLTNERASLARATWVVIHFILFALGTSDLVIRQSYFW